MRRIKKGVLLAGLFALCMCFCNCGDVKAAVEGTPDKPFSTGTGKEQRSIEKYIFDTYGGVEHGSTINDKTWIAKAYTKYTKYKEKYDNAPYYIRVSKDMTAEALNSDDTKEVEDGGNTDELYVFWISKIKRAGGSSTGLLKDCCNTEAIKIETENCNTGADTWYNSFGYGIRESKFTGGYNSAANLGQDSSCFIWYSGEENDNLHVRKMATTEYSPDISSFWVNTKGGETGYVVYYMKYSTLFRTVEEYNERAKDGDQIEPTQSDSDANLTGQKYARYDLWLNGAIAKQSSNKWTKTSHTFSGNHTLFEVFRAGTEANYADQNYNVHIQLHILNCVPIVVRAWDVSTNKCVKVDSSYYMQAFDSDLAGVDVTDGVYWDMGSSIHTTDIQQAMLKFMYTSVDNGEGDSRAKVAYNINGSKYKTLNLASYVKRVNMEKITEDDGYAVLYFPKYEGSTSVNKVETADAYAPIGFRIFAYGEETQAALVSNNYKALKTYDPITETKTVEGDFKYPEDPATKRRISSYCYKVTNVKAGKKSFRGLDFDIRKDVRTSKGTLKHTEKVQWPAGNLRYDSSKNQHTEDHNSVTACKFFTRFCLTTNVTKLKNKNLWWTADGTRYVSKSVKSVGAGQVEKLENGRTARTSIKEVAEALGSKTSNFSFKQYDEFYVDNTSCIVIDILVSEMYYEQQSYNIEQLAVLDNKYDTEHGVWGYIGSGTASVKSTKAAEDSDGVVKKDLPSLVHSEADDSQYDNSVSLLDTFQETTNDYLRFDISEYGKKEQTGTDGSSDGIIYTLEGWSHYISPSNNDADSTNAGYMDSINSDVKIKDEDFALYSSKWYKYLKTFGDQDDDTTDSVIANKVAVQKDLVVDSWTYNLFYVIKPPIVGIVYVYDANKNAYEVKHVSAKSYKTFGTDNIAAAKKEAADAQLKSTGVQSYILYDSGYHRAGDRVTVEICGNWDFEKWIEHPIIGFDIDLRPIYGNVYNVRSQDLAGAYLTNATVDFYDSSTDLPTVGSYSGEVADSSDPWNSACLYNYYGSNIKEAQCDASPEYEWLDCSYGTYTDVKPRSSVTYTFTMPETTTAIVAVYGGQPQPTSKKTFKMRVQYLQYDGTSYKEISVDQIKEQGTGDSLDVTPNIDIDGTILDIGFKEYKQDNVPLSKEYYQKPDVEWGQSKDRSYTLHPDENKVVVYVIIDTPKDTNQWVTVVYLDAGQQEIPDDGSTVALDYVYMGYKQFKGVGKAITGLNGKDVDWCGIAYGEDLPLYDQIENTGGEPVFINPSPDTGSKTAWSLEFQGTAKQSGSDIVFGKPITTKDAAGRNITWESKGRASYDVGSGEGRGCVIYVLVSEQWIPPIPEEEPTRLEVTYTETVEPLDPHTVDWEKATKPTVDGSSNLSAANYDIPISADNEDMRVMLANDELNSTRDAYDPLISIPTSEFVKQYARVKKYETEWQYEKVTVTWTFTYTCTVMHNVCYTDPCTGHSLPEGGVYYCHHHGHHVTGANEHKTTVSTTRYTTFYRIRYGDVYVPKDVTTFNESFGTYGTGLYNKTLDKFGHATMLVKNNAYQNNSLGFHMLSNADVSYPEIDMGKLFTNDLDPHETIHDCCVSTATHNYYCKYTKENPAACKRRLELAVGKQNLYRSSNEEWIFGDGECNFTELSNSNMNHDNAVAHNYIEDPPEAGYTLAEGLPYASVGTADKSNTYSEFNGYAGGISQDQFYQNGIPIPADTLNGLYESKAIVRWQLHTQAKPHTNDLNKVMRIEADSDIVFTPTVTLDCVIVDDTAVQKINQNSNVNFTMDNVFRVKIDATGINSDDINFPGYGYDNYDRFLNKDVVDDTLQHVGYVKFPFPVIKKALVNGETIDTYYKEGTWIACIVGETEFIPAYYKDEMEMAQVQFMNRAENVLVKNTFTYEAPGLNLQQIHDSDNVDDMVQNDLMNGSIPDWDRISYPITNGATIDSFGVHSNYIATDVLDCNLYGRIYGFSIIDQTDYPNWKGTFRNADGTLNMTKYTSGKNDRERWLRQTDSLLTVPTVKGSNKQFVNAGVLKPGYAIRYTFETVGNMFSSSDYVEITPKFYWVYKDGTKGSEVDVYYKEQSSANSTVNLIKVGSEADKNNKKVLSMESFGFGHDYNYYTESTNASSDTGNVKNENGDVDSSGNRLKYSLVQDTEKDNLVHAGEMLGYSNLQEYLEHKEEVWYPSLTKLVNRMQTYDGLRHETILSNGNGDPFSALKSAVILNSDTLGVSREDIYKRIQEWYGEFYLPSNVYVTWEGTDVAGCLTSGDGGMVLTGNESCWLKNGYLAVEFDIVTYRNGEKWLAYDNGAYYDDNIDYNVGDMWEREGYVTSKTDSKGTTFDLIEGTTVLYQIGYPEGDSSNDHSTSPSAAEDYEGAGTH